MLFANARRQAHEWILSGKTLAAVARGIVGFAAESDEIAPATAESQWLEVWVRLSRAGRVWLM